MDFQHLIVAQRDGVLSVTLNRPDVLNSFNGRMADELQSVLAGAADDASVRAVLLTGSGRAFSAGQDLAEVLPRQGEPRPDLGDVVKRQYTPIVLDLTGNGIKLSSVEKGVMFDLNDTGQQIPTAWIASTENAFLVRDIKGTGKIDSGAQMFGTATVLKSGMRADNGFQALKELDDDNDNFITPKDAAYGSLFLWTDKNFNGISEKGEIMSLKKAGIQYIDLKFLPVNEVDAFGNRTKFRSTYSRKLNGASKVLNLIDVWFDTLVTW